METKTVTLRCMDNEEAVVFTRYNYKNFDTDYEINIEDSYCCGDYMGIKGRFKRAWKAFWAKPIRYTGIYCKDKEQMEEFLQDCLNTLKD